MLLLIAVSRLLHRRCVAAHHVEAGTVGDELDLDLFAFVLVEFGHVLGVVERHVHDRRIILRHLNDDPVHLVRGRMRLVRRLGLGVAGGRQRKRKTGQRDCGGTEHVWSVVLRIDSIRGEARLLPTMLASPLQEFLVQALLISRQGGGRLAASGVSGDSVAATLRRGLSVQPLLGRRKALQARHLRVQVDVLPLGVETRPLQLTQPAEQVVRQPGDALVAIRRLRPVERCQDRRNRDGWTS